MIMELIMKKYRKNYTLLEILVAMGIFVIICVVVMRFFSGAQRVIVNSTNSNNLHADARVFFDLIGRDLQSIVYNNKIGVEGIYPFANSYYIYEGYHWSSPTSKQLYAQKDNIKEFYTDIVPERFEDELSYPNRDYAPLLCFISNQTDLPAEADYETCEIRYTFVPAGVHDATYLWKRVNNNGSTTIMNHVKFSGGTLLRSCTFSDNRKKSLSNINTGRHPHDFSAFPVVNSLGKAVPEPPDTDSGTRVYQVFNDESSGEFERVIGGVYRMNISCFKLCSDGVTGKFKKIKMFDVNKRSEVSNSRKESSTEPNNIYMDNSEWPLPRHTYPSDGTQIQLGQLGHPLPDMIKVDLYMLDSRSWNSLMNCYKFDGSTYTLIHKGEAKKILNLKLRYFSKNFYIPKVNASTL